MDLKKAAVWALIGGLALFGATEFAPGFYGSWYALLSAIGFGVLLPVIASLHLRHEPLRRSGAVLGTIAGTCVVLVGLAGAPETNPASIVVRAVWWWTIGKMWAETNVLPRAFGWITMIGALLFALVGGITALGSRVDTSPDLALRLLFSTWLVVLAALLWPRRPVA